MSGLGITQKNLLEQQWRGQLSEYVTAVAWSVDGCLAVSSAAGEVLLWDGGNGDSRLILGSDDTGEQSIDCLDFSPDGQFLAAGGQDGGVRIWQVKPQLQRITTLKNAPKWVDHMRWSPTANQLAFSLGRYVQVWDAVEKETIITLPFDSSSVLGITWHPQGQHLAIAGDQGAKVWDSRNWDDDPYLVDMPAASMAIAWSPDGKYLASGNLDLTITVVQWDNPHPWVMRGFPGKIRNLRWSKSLSNTAPLLAASSGEGIVIWKKQTDDRQGWDARVLELHTDIIQDIAFQPKSLLLASASNDGWICLWQKAKQIAQIMNGATQGFSCLAWHPGGHQLAAGGQNGEVLVWSESKRGKGFG